MQREFCTASSKAKAISSLLSWAGPSQPFHLSMPQRPLASTGEMHPENAITVTAERTHKNTDVMHKRIGPVLKSTTRVTFPIMGDVSPCVSSPLPMHANSPEAGNASTRVS